MRKHSKTAGALAACMLSLFWITAVIRWIAGDGGLMAAEMLRNAPPEDTGISAEEYPAMGALTASFLTGTGRFQYARTGENGEEILRIMMSLRIIRVLGLYEFPPEYAPKY